MTEEIALVSSKKFIPTRTGLVINRDATDKEWAEFGAQIKNAQEGILWILGDWSREGVNKHSEVYADTCEKYGYERKTVMHAELLSDTFKIERRRSDLTWSFHYEVRSLASDGNKADELLERAATEGWSEKRLRKAVREGKRTKKVEGIKTEALAEGRDKKWNIFLDDMTTWESPRKYDIIITDPPYSEKWLPLFETLSIRANEWLKDNSLLVVMCPHYHLDKILQLMTPNIDYYWIGAYLTPGSQANMLTRQVNTGWKPILIFSNGKYKGKTFGDVFRSDKKPDKKLHEWGQSVTGLTSIVEQFCEPYQYVIDPFCGVASTGIAALRHGCYFDGVELDELSYIKLLLTYWRRRMIECRLALGSGYMTKSDLL